MTQIRKVPVPDNSLVTKSFPSFHYSDCYTSRFESDKVLNLTDCINLLFFEWPKWAEVLMKIRNVLVAPFGLKADEDNIVTRHTDSLSNASIGKQIGLFEVKDCNENEILLIICDKHLDAALSMILQKHNRLYEIHISTTVKYNKTLGRVYFSLIRPFHKIIVKTLLRRLIRKYTKT